MDARRTIVAVLLAVVAGSGCSGRQAYEAVQQHHLQQCRDLPLGRYETCLAEVGPAWDDWQRLRGEVMDDDTGTP